MRGKRAKALRRKRSELTYVNGIAIIDDVIHPGRKYGGQPGPDPHAGQRRIRVTQTEKQLGDALKAAFGKKET